MEASKVLEKFDATLARWKEILATIPDDRFEAVPAAGGWSVGQVCHHVSAAFEYFSGEIDRCARGEGTPRGGSVMGWFMTFVGSLPPMRVKVPKLPERWRKIEAPDSVSRAGAMELLDGIAAGMRERESAVAGSDPRQRSKHMVAGWFNASQWYQLSEMHLRHHLRQLGRLQAEFGAGPS